MLHYQAIILTLHESYHRIVSYSCAGVYIREFNYFDLSRSAGEAPAPQ